MTVHILNQKNAVSFFDQSDAHNGDIFDLTAKGAGMVLSGLSNTTILFLGNAEHATIAAAGPTKIYDEGQGTHLIFSMTGLVTIYDFQHDKTGYIQDMASASKIGHLTVSSDGHGGSFLTGSGLTVHLVGDAHVAASQHS